MCRKPRLFYFTKPFSDSLNKNSVFAYMKPNKVLYKQGYDFSKDNYTEDLKLIPSTCTVSTFLPIFEFIIINMFTQSF